MEIKNGVKNKMVLNKKQIQEIRGLIVELGSVNEKALSWHKYFKGYNEKELKVISQFINLNKKGIDGVIEMSKEKQFKTMIKKIAQKGRF